MEDILSCATSFQISKSVQVSYRHGSKNWTVVIDRGWVLNDQGRRELEPSPSNRDEEFILHTRFDFTTAWRKATKVAIEVAREQEQWKRERESAMPISEPRNDLGDLGPSWEGNAEQFSKVRDTVLATLKKNYPYCGVDEEKLDALTNHFLKQHSFSIPGDLAQAFKEFVLSGVFVPSYAEYNPAAHFAFELLRFAIKEDK